MSAIKVTQNIGDLTGSQVSSPIALKSGYLRITPEADAYISVGSASTVSATNGLWITENQTELIKESVYSTPTTGVTNASAAIKFTLQDGMSCPFNEGDLVEVTGGAPSGINTAVATVSTVLHSDPLNGIHGPRVTLNYGDANVTPTDGVGEIRKVVRVCTNTTSGSKTHISEVQIVGG